MKKQKLILFDWGNIVESINTGYSNSKAWQDLFIKCGYNGKLKIFNNLSKYRLSAITNEEQYAHIYENIKRDFNLNTNFQEYIKYYKEIFDKIDYYTEVRDYEISLKDKCYIGILSNLSIYDKKRLDKQVRLSNYDFVFLSFELGCRKPDYEIYEKVQKQVSFNKEDILFIDDNPENVRVAKEFGWNSYQATGLELDKIKTIINDFLQ